MRDWTSPLKSSPFVYIYPYACTHREKIIKKCKKIFLKTAPFCNLKGLNTWTQETIIKNCLVIFKETLWQDNINPWWCNLPMHFIRKLLKCFDSSTCLQKIQRTEECRTLHSPDSTSKNSSIRDAARKTGRQKTNPNNSGFINYNESISKNREYWDLGGFGYLSFEWNYKNT